MVKISGDGRVSELKLPERIGRLRELAYNLWWSWHPGARNLFRSLDYPLWSDGHNPVRQLREMSPETLKAAARDRNFLDSYDAVMAAFDAEMTGAGKWFAGRNPGLLPGGVAFFSMEFAIHNSLPIYAGGLGILAGDICKEASDLGLPMVGLGFMYPQGYFHQRVSQDGWQEEIYRLLDFSEAPISACAWPDGCGPLVEIELGERQVFLRTWLVRVGRVNLYLLDTDLEENSPQDRLLSARLYTANREQRLQQEIVLGVGGVRVLQALGINPSVWHANEGHTAFMMMERLRQEMAKGATFSVAIEKVRTSTIFTTHTPVAAGHDVFPGAMVDHYLGGLWESSGAHREMLLNLGKPPDAAGSEFNMTVLGLRLSGIRNGVSKLHSKTSRGMWRNVWPGTPEENVPILPVTNGVHVPTWITPEMRGLYERHLGNDWLEKQDDTVFWEAVSQIPDAELWDARQKSKVRMLESIRARNRMCASARKCSADQVVAMGAQMDADSLTIGFARRFAEYKRPTLVLSDIELLKNILTDRKMPVQLVFAGKSHPADIASKGLLHEVYAAALGREFEGRVAFVEDYDIHIAHSLVAGVDVWLNTPRRLEEACGTSGMKASLNGVLHFSVPDGWWYEAYNGHNGWVIDDITKPPDLPQENSNDARSLYRTLQEQVIPLYYDRDRAGVPHGWVRLVREAIRSIVPQVCARRMMKDYINFYLSLSRERVKV